MVVVSVLLLSVLVPVACASATSYIVQRGTVVAQSLAGRLGCVFNRGERDSDIGVSAVYIRRHSLECIDRLHGSLLLFGRGCREVGEVVDRHIICRLIVCKFGRHFVELGQLGVGRFGERSNLVVDSILAFLADKLTLFGRLGLDAFRALFRRQL